MTRRSPFVPAISAVIASAVAVPGFYAHAQVDTGSLAGTVRDNTGAVIPDTDLLLREERTGVSASCAPAVTVPSTSAR